MFFRRTQKKLLADSPLYHVIQQFRQLLNAMADRYSKIPQDPKLKKTYALIKFGISQILKIDKDIDIILHLFENQNNPLLLSFLPPAKRLYNRFNNFDIDLIDKLGEVIDIDTQLVKQKMAENTELEKESTDLYDPELYIPIYEFAKIPADIIQAHIKINSFKKDKISRARELLFGEVKDSEKPLDISMKSAKMFLLNTAEIYAHVLSKFSEQEMRIALAMWLDLSNEFYELYLSATASLPTKTAELMPFLNPKALSRYYFGMGSKLITDKPKSNFHYSLKLHPKVLDVCLDQHFQDKIPIIRAEVIKFIFNDHRSRAITTDKPDRLYQFMRLNEKCLDELDAEADALEAQIVKFTKALEAQENGCLDTMPLETMIVTQKNIFAKFETKILELSGQSDPTEEKRFIPDEKHTIMTEKFVKDSYKKLFSDAYKVFKEKDSSLQTTFKRWLLLEIGYINQYRLNRYSQQIKTIKASKDISTEKLNTLTNIRNSLLSVVNALQYPDKVIEFDFLGAKDARKPIDIVMDTCYYPLLGQLSVIIWEMENSIQQNKQAEAHSNNYSTLFSSVATTSASCIDGAKSQTYHSPQLL